MIAEIKPYPEYKDSGVPEIGLVPAGWEVRTLGEIGTFRRGSGGSKDDEVAEGIPCVRYGDLYTTHRFSITHARAFVAPARAADYTPIRVGDVLFATSGETLEEIGKSAVNLIQSEACAGGDLLILRPRLPTSARFLGYACDSPSAVLQKARGGKGVTVMHIYDTALKRVRIAVPPLDEQVAIARFLDHADSQTQRLIAAKERLIALLDEERQATIDRAVTRGLDPKARVKPSWVAWLGDVPEHWDVTEVRRLGRIVGGMTPSMERAEFWNGDISWVSPKDMRGERVEASEDHITSRALAETGIHTVPAESALMVVRGMILARRVPIALSSIATTLNQDMKAIVPNGRVSGEFLSLALRAAQRPLMAMVDEAGHGTRRLPSERWTRLRVPVPPLEEQASIVSFARRVRDRMADASDATRRQIIHLHELRTCLISDVVTGKLDIREVAAKLSADGSADPEPVGEALVEAVV